MCKRITQMPTNSLRKMRDSKMRDKHRHTAPRANETHGRKNGRERGRANEKKRQQKSIVQQLNCAQAH